MVEKKKSLFTLDPIPREGTSILGVPFYSERIYIGHWGQHHGSVREKCYYYYYPNGVLRQHHVLLSNSAPGEEPWLVRAVGVKGWGLMHVLIQENRPRALGEGRGKKGPRRPVHLLGTFRTDVRKCADLEFAISKNTKIIHKMARRWRGEQRFLGVYFISLCFSGQCWW